ncbi:MAG TPA: transglycosylase domain-containing protein, partial [Anaerolineae bacterium]|nr:transglycosylase domain-containing protein [Anaerolineae bacterium]
MPNNPESRHDGPEPTPEGPPAADPTRRLVTGRETRPLPAESALQEEPLPAADSWKPAEMRPLEPPAAEPTRRLPEAAAAPAADADQAQWIRIRPDALKPQTPQPQPPAPAVPATPRPAPTPQPQTPASRVTTAPAPVSPKPPQFTSPKSVAAPMSSTPPELTPPHARPTERMAVKRRRPWASALLGITLALVGLFLVGLIVAIVGYIVLAAQLPPVDELRAREPDFASSQIYASDGSLLYEITDPNAGKRTYVRIDQIDRDLQLATVATEDRNFYVHSGFDPYAIARALYYAFQEKGVVSGASTITQQVARNILLTPEEREGQSYLRKVKEIILAEELTRRYSKDEILEIYLNNINYGNMAYGVDAAARTYFGASASNLTLGQASFLAGLPQMPAVYDPFHGGLDAALKRHKVVLSLMVEAGFITQAEADAAAAEMEAYQFSQRILDRIPAPHFVFYVRQQVEEALGPQALYRGTGLRIHTTLDLRLQQIAEEEVRKGVANLAANKVSNGALVALQPA